MHGRDIQLSHGHANRRLFELLMAFDALRLRNIIQLFGILSMSIISTIHPLTQDRNSIPPLLGRIRRFADTPN